MTSVLECLLQAQLVRSVLLAGFLRVINATPARTLQMEAMMAAEVVRITVLVLSFLVLVLLATHSS